MAGIPHDLWKALSGLSDEWEEERDRCDEDEYEAPFEISHEDVCALLEHLRRKIHRLDETEIEVTEVLRRWDHRRCQDFSTKDGGGGGGGGDDDDDDDDDDGGGGGGGGRSTSSSSSSSSCSSSNVSGSKRSRNTFRSEDTTLTKSPDPNDCTGDGSFNGTCNRISMEKRNAQCDFIRWYRAGQRNILAQVVQGLDEILATAVAGEVQEDSDDNNDEEN